MGYLIRTHTKRALRCILNTFLLFCITFFCSYSTYRWKLDKTIEIMRYVSVALRLFILLLVLCISLEYFIGVTFSLLCSVYCYVQLFFKGNVEFVFSRGSSYVRGKIRFYLWCNCSSSSYVVGLSFIFLFNTWEMKVFLTIKIREEKKEYFMKKNTQKRCCNSRGNLPVCWTCFWKVRWVNRTFQLCSLTSIL